MDDGSWQKDDEDHHQIFEKSLKIFQNGAFGAVLGRFAPETLAILTPLGPKPCYPTLPPGGRRESEQGVGK